MIAVAARAAGLEQDWQDKRIWHSARRRVEVCFKWAGPTLELAQYQDHGHTLVLGLIFMTVYVKTLHFFDWECMEGGLGFSFTSDSLQLHWGKKTTVHWYPWDWDFHKRWELVEDIGYASSDNAWIEMPRHARHGLLATEHVFDFTYVLKNGDVQKRKATVYVDRMEWRWRCAWFLPWPRLVRDCINVSFDDEVGERTGSWKGGTMGCGYDMLPGEDAEQTLRRMERERKFT